jgi:hypothetical protein
VTQVSLAVYVRCIVKSGSVSLYGLSLKTYQEKQYTPLMQLVQLDIPSDRKVVPGIKMTSDNFSVVNARRGTIEVEEAFLPDVYKLLMHPSWAVENAHNALNFLAPPSVLGRAYRLSYAGLAKGVERQVMRLAKIFDLTITESHVHQQIYGTSKNPGLYLATSTEIERKRTNTRITIDPMCRFFPCPKSSLP